LEYLVPALERLLYASRATGRTSSLFNMATILSESQRNNDRHGLTGALAAHEDRYIQVIEGEPERLTILCAVSRATPAIATFR
jgi:hypothetical protein